MPYFEILHDNKIRRRHRSVVVLAVVAVAVFAGCYPAVNKYDARVSGTVTVGGELAPRGLVAFHPVSGGHAASGSIHKDGSYALRTGQGKLGEVDGGTVASGDYIVTVTVSLPATREPLATGTVESEGDSIPNLVEARTSAGGPPPSGPMLSAAKYRSKATSPLRLSVEPGDNVFVLELDRAAASAVEGAEADDEEALEETVSEEVDVSVEETEEPAAEEEAAGSPATEGTP